MVRALLIFSMTLALSACSNTNKNSDTLTLAYINANIYPGSAIDCQVRFISNHEVIGCKAISLSGNSNMHLYFYENGKFHAINGTARQAVETHFAGYGNIVLASLPISRDLDIPKILQEFK